MSSLSTHMKRIALVFSLVLATLAAAVASADVSVFKTSFSTRSEYSAMERLSGPTSMCKRSWRNKKALGVETKGGEVDCAIATPVEGDSKRPDHTVKAVAVVTKKTDKKVRRDTYVGLAVRASSRSGYEMRVFPKERRYQLLKSGEVLQEADRVKDIGGLDEKNRLQLSAIGTTVTLRVNGKTLAELKDKNAEQVKGTKTAVTYGARKRSKKAAGIAFFDKLKVQVPTP